MAKKPAKTAEVVENTAPVGVSLNDVIAATKANSFVYTAPTFHESLVASGDVEVNPEMTNEAGELATRATAKHLNPESPDMFTADTATVTAKPKFEIRTGEIPTVTRKSSGVRAGRTPIYPFADLDENQYFFVPNVGDKPAAKALASTVAGKNLEYSEVIEGQTRTNRKGKVVPATRQVRKFKAFDTTEMVDGVEVKGAKVFRVAVE